MLGIAAVGTGGHRLWVMVGGGGCGCEAGVGDWERGWWRRVCTDSQLELDET